MAIINWFNRIKWRYKILFIIIFLIIILFFLYRPTYLKKSFYAMTEEGEKVYVTLDFTFRRTLLLAYRYEGYITIDEQRYISITNFGQSNDNGSYKRIPATMSWFLSDSHVSPAYEFLTGNPIEYISIISQINDFEKVGIAVEESVYSRSGAKIYYGPAETLEDVNAMLADPNFPRIVTPPYDNYFS